MTINGVSSTGIQPGTMGMGAGGQMDAVSKDLQNQIENLRKQMNELSSNQEMPMETKMKKRQELQKQVSDLEVQLRQHQMEVKREAATKKREGSGSMDELLGVKQQSKQKDGQNVGMSAGSMEALISADASMKAAEVHGSVATKMEGRACVLEEEIKLDSSRGGNPERKKAELAEVKAVAEQATSSQMVSLAEANETMQEAGKEEQKGTDAKTDEKDQKDDTAKTDAEEREDASGQSTFDTEMPGVPFSRGYTTVDVKV